MLLSSGKCHSRNGSCNTSGGRLVPERKRSTTDPNKNAMLWEPRDDCCGSLRLGIIFLPVGWHTDCSNCSDCILDGSGSGRDRLVQSQKPLKHCVICRTPVQMALILLGARPKLPQYRNNIIAQDQRVLVSTSKDQMNLYDRKNSAQTETMLQTPFIHLVLKKPSLRFYPRTRVSISSSSPDARINGHRISLVS